MAHSPNGEIYAYIVGDEEAAVGDIGKVVYYLQRMNGSTAVFEPLKNSAGAVVVSGWTIQAPFEANGIELLMIVMPEYLKNTFGADEHDGMFLAVINDESDSQPYLRIGHYQGAGRVHRQSGLNYLANREVLNNFEYTLYPDSDHDGVPDNYDKFPEDPKEQFDSDKDGVGDHADAFPFNPNEQKTPTTMAWAITPTRTTITTASPMPLTPTQPCPMATIQAPALCWWVMWPKAAKPMALPAPPATAAMVKAPWWRPRCSR